jgi:murine toxin
MPGNHSKVFFIDDQVCYVGSDNLYPNGNLEFGYLIEGQAVQDLLGNYWSEIWWHSMDHCCRL